MAPSHCYCVEYRPGDFISTMASACMCPTRVTYNRYIFIDRRPQIKKETKKEKVARIAKEKMLASWKTYDEILPNLYKIKQICRPEHRLNHMGRRN